MDCCDLKLKTPFTMIVVGPTSCGKTTFVKRLLIRHNLFFTSRNPGSVIWCYKTWQPAYSRMRNVQFLEGHPTTEWIHENVDKRMGNCTIVIDDLALSCTADTDELFTVLSHHKNLNIILIAQNLFTKNPFYREISLNSTYHVVFKNVQLASWLNNSLRVTQRPLRRYLKKATKPVYSYLFIDYHQTTPDNSRFRFNIMGEGGILSQYIN